MGKISFEAMPKFSQFPSHLVGHSVAQLKELLDGTIQVFKVTNVSLVNVVKAKGTRKWHEKLIPLKHQSELYIFRSSLLLCCFPSSLHCRWTMTVQLLVLHLVQQMLEVFDLVDQVTFGARFQQHLQIF